MIVSANPRVWLPSNHDSTHCNHGCSHHVQPAPRILRRPAEAGVSSRPEADSAPGHCAPWTTSRGLHGIERRVSMRKRSKAFASGVGLVAAASVIAACSGSSSTGGTGGSGSSVSLSSGTQGLNPGSGSPKSGGTLNMLGTGDVDYMDSNISYYSIGYLGQRPWLRGLYAYPAIARKDHVAGAGPGHGPAGGQQRRQDLHDDHSLGCDVGHLAGPPGHRGRCAPRPQAFVQPGAAVRWPARLRVADRRVRAVLQRFRQRWPTRRPRSSRTSTRTRSPASRSPGRP